MHCPNCGTKATGEQKFCRSCGLKLEKVYQLLGEELAAADLATENRIRRFEHWRNATALLTLTFFVITLLIVFVHEIKAAIDKGSSEIYATLVAFVITIGLLTALSFAAYSAYLRQKLAQRKTQPSAAPFDAAPTAKLADEAAVVELVSITEHTTEILEPNSPEGGERHGNQSGIAAGVRSRDGQHAQDA